MTIASYEDLLSAARAQQQPQRLLFAFAQAESAGQQAQPGREGGTLTPVMCVDKLPAELGSFEELAQESRQMQVHWDVVFVASLSGQGGQAPQPEAAEAPLKQMITAIQTGQIGKFLAFNREGELLTFS